MYLFESLLQEYKKIWWESRPLKEPSLIRAYQEKHVVKDNDKALIGLKKELIYLFSHMDKREPMTEEKKIIIKDRIMNFMTTTLGVERKCCEILDQEGYYEMTLAFMERAKDLDERFTFDDVFQALRNVWVMISFQIYFGKPVVLTDSVFAYSMLYPLTDNYLDDPRISYHDKITFNKRFYEKIKTGQNMGMNPDENRIFHMIDLIEGQYPRQDYPEVFTSLLAILDGQNKSLDQQRMINLYHIDLMGYTFYKGGTSVLADAYLVNGKLTKDQGLFAYGYGVILQIADDLQDMDEDLGHNHNTMVNTGARFGKLDGFHLQYESFINTFLNQIFKKDSEKQAGLYGIILISLEQLLFHGVIENKKYFSKKHFKDFMEDSRFSESAYKRLNKKVKQVIQNYY